MLQCLPMSERPLWQPVRGTRDVLPPEQARLEQVQTGLEQTLATWGYTPLALPLVEPRDLYLRKAGDELADKLYDWVHHGRSLALRPELTASVLRAYLRGLQSEPLPVRLRTGGPVFRYERPQRGTYRQFTLVGAEHIGGMAPRADAELVGLACAGLDAVGVSGWTLQIGHVGIARTLVSKLGLVERTASQLLWSMERLRREGIARVRAEMQPSDDELFDLGPLHTLPDDQLQTLLLTMLRAVGLPLDNSTRPPEAIVARLVRKLRRGDPEPAVEHALALLQQLGTLHGPPDHVLPAAAALLHSEGVSSAPLDELQTILDLVQVQGIDRERIMVDLGMSRGLHYHTGMMFEIVGMDGLQLCGGGRYDDLIAGLGGPSVPALGFAYGVERIAATAEVGVVVQPLVMVMAADNHYPAALRIANELRMRGYHALLDSRGRTLGANLRDATRRGARAVVIAEEDAVTWHDLRDGPRRGSLEDVVPTEARVTRGEQHINGTLVTPNS